MRRKFESLNIESLLLDAGVETDQLMPKDEVSAKINLPPPVNASLTYVLCLLHYFDASYTHTCTLHICMDLQQLELLEESFCLINCLKIILIHIAYLTTNAFASTSKDDLASLQESLTKKVSQNLSRERLIYTIPHFHRLTPPIFTYKNNVSQSIHRDQKSTIN